MVRSRRPRAVWLLDTDDPNGAGVMTMRRIEVLRDTLRSTAVCLQRGGVRAPGTSPFRSVLSVGSATGRLTFMAADVVVTTSARTLAWAAKRRVLGMRIVHVLHTPPDRLLGNEGFMHHVHLVERLVVPGEVDAAAFARTVGLRPDQVRNADDFTLSSDRLLSTAEGTTVLAAGRFAGQTGAADIVRGFGLAQAELAGWQLRLCGWGSQRREVNAAIAEFELEGRALVMGPTYDLQAEYLDAGIAVRVAGDEAAGLSVLEALTAGVPVLGADTVPAVRRFVVDGVNGHVLTRADPESIAAGLISLSDPVRRAELAAGARSQPSGLLTEADRQGLIELFSFERPRVQVEARQARGARLGQVGELSLTDLPEAGETVAVGSRQHLVMTDVTPREARTRMLTAVLAALTDHGVRGFVVKGASSPGPTVGVRVEDREAALTAVATLTGPGVYLQEYGGTGLRRSVRPLSPAVAAGVPAECLAVRIAQLFTTPDRSLSYGMDYGTVVEFWVEAPEMPDHLLAPRRNAAALVVHVDELEPATVELEGQTWPSIRLFDRTMVGDVDFPVDVVYTWVDGADPVWQERFARAKAEAAGVDFHPAALAGNRYESRDELLYSLRSLELYAPWVRHVYLVTDQQTPTWLREDQDRVTVVDHRDIYADPSVLPVFNSSAIISQLHHIDGLSEHYLYLNDDMLFGRDVVPEDFWHGSGIAKVFPAYLTRPFGPAHVGDEPHFNITKNIRAVMEASVGRSVSTAIRHTPYPQLRSVNYELEERFAAELTRTAGQRFRHHTDIAQDQLFHYYAQATGRAVASTISYDYVNVGLAESVVRLRRLLAARNRSVFCLNDAPEPGFEPMKAEQVHAFLAAYFPVRASFEVPGP
ncbi:MAG TPA: stealth conserved region 3 domain-containing protein [Propionibacteriaceae bacterium]